jgi:hypothetical protein
MFVAQLCATAAAWGAWYAGLLIMAAAFFG